MDKFATYLTEAFTKQHYIKIAAILKSEMGETDSKDGKQAIRSIAVRLSRVFKDDNPAFDEDRFIDAAGV